MISDLEFVQYMSAKICHDLAGSLGAISSGVEFVDSSDTAVQKKALELIHLSSSQAINTMKLFRQIYGIAKYEGDADLCQIKEFAQMLVKDRNIQLEFLIPGSLPPEKAFGVDTGKLTLAFILLAKTSLIHGGNITIAIHPNANHQNIDIVVSGKEMKIKSSCHNIILDKKNHDEISPVNIDSYYIKRLKEDLKVKVDIKEEPDRVTYSIEYK